MNQDQETFGALPTFFRGACATAARGGGGPENNYEVAGFTLGRHISDLAPHELEDDEWRDRLTKLAAGEADTIAWLKTNVPRCMALVPSKRRAQLARGVERAIAEYGIG